MAAIERIGADEFRIMTLDGLILTLTKEGLDAFLESLR